MTSEGSGTSRMSKDRLAELALVFLKLGATAFGGPAAHIAMMEEELVRRRKWLTHEKFLDLMAMTNLIPGPNSTEMAIHIGHLRAGWTGLIVAGCCFIVPALLIVLAIAYAYVRWSTLPQLEGVLYGVKPVVIAVIFQALWNLTGKAVKTRKLAALAIVAAIVNFFGANELVVLFGAGAALGIAKWVGAGDDRRLKPLLMLLGVCGGILALSTYLILHPGQSREFSLDALFLYFAGSSGNCVGDSDRT